MSANTKISSNNNPSCISDVSGHVSSSETNNPLFKYPIVKLIDFGFANSWQEGHKLKTSCGSLAYSAPEILLGEWHVDLTDKPSNWTCVCLSVSDNIGIRSEFTSTKRLQKWHYEIMLSCQCIRFFDDKIWTWNSISWRFCYSMLSLPLHLWTHRRSIWGRQGWYLGSWMHSLHSTLRCNPFMQINDNETLIR